MVTLQKKVRSGWSFPGQSPEAVVEDISPVVEGFPEAPLIFEESSDIFGFDTRRLCTSPAKEIEEELFSDTLKAQGVVITKNSIYIARARQCNPPVFPWETAGQSVALVSALEAAGLLRSHVYKITRVRGVTMKESPPGMMVALLHPKGVNLKGVEKLCRRYGTVIGLYNSRGQVVISGFPKAVEKVAAEAIALGYAISSRVINRRYAFHSSLMAESAVAVEECLKDMEFPKKLNCPVLENLKAKKIRKGEDAKEALVADITGPNHWDLIVRRMDREVDEVYEMGPGSVLTKMTNRALQDRDGEEAAKEEAQDEKTVRRRFGTIAKLATGGVLFGLAGAIVYELIKEDKE